MNAQEVGLKIVQYRKKLGLTQRELAERLHVSDKAVSKWERGINYPDITLFDDIARELHISVVELLGIEENSKEEIVQGISEISKYEKEKICRALFRRGISYYRVWTYRNVKPDICIVSFLSEWNIRTRINLHFGDGGSDRNSDCKWNLFDYSCEKALQKQFHHKHNCTACN